VKSVSSSATHHKAGAWELPTGGLGGKHFKSFEAFQKALVTGRGYLPVGTSLKINLGFGPGGNPTRVGGFNKSSPFTATVKDGVLTLKTKSDAKVGDSDRLYIQPGALPGLKPKKIPFTLSVGLRPMVMG
jgi:hypothetical protein